MCIPLFSCCNPPVPPQVSPMCPVLCTAALFFSKQLLQPSFLCRGAREFYSWMKHPGTYDWGKGAIDNFPNADACASYVDTNKVAPKLTLQLEDKTIENQWDVNFVVLQLAYTTGPNQQIVTKTWGSCDSRLPQTPTPIAVGEAGTTISLCADATPRWRWTLKLTTGSGIGAGTNADIQVAINCGSFVATNKLIALTPLCKDEDNCFDQGNVNEFSFEYIPGIPHVDPTPPLAAGNYPSPACTAAGVEPELTISFQGDSFNDGKDALLMLRCTTDITDTTQPSVLAEWDLLATETTLALGEGMAGMARESITN